MNVSRDSELSVYSLGASDDIADPPSPLRPVNGIDASRQQVVAAKRYQLLEVAGRHYGGSVSPKTALLNSRSLQENGGFPYFVAPPGSPCPSSVYGSLSSSPSYSTDENTYTYTGGAEETVVETPTSVTSVGTEAVRRKMEMLQQKFQLVDHVPSLEDYTMEETLGSGSFGTVTKALSRRDGKHYAIKMCRLKNARAVKQVLSEIRLTAKGSRHPNIIRYVEAMYNNNAIYIVLQYASGGSLRQLIENDSSGVSLSESRVMRFFVQICLGVQHLHGLKILHRDLKTPNVFLMEGDHIVLGDFGLSKELEKSFCVTVAGTPPYLSPEIVEGRAYNQKSDIWCLGVILCELVSCGKRPFDEVHGLGPLLHAIVNSPPKSLPTVYSISLANLYNSLLEKDSERRPTIDAVLATDVCQEAANRWYSTHEAMYKETSDNMILNQSFFANRGQDDAAAILTHMEEERRRKREEREAQEDEMVAAAEAAVARAEAEEKQRKKEERKRAVDRAMEQAEMERKYREMEIRTRSLPTRPAPGTNIAVASSS